MTAYTFTIVCQGVSEFADDVVSQITAGGAAEVTADSVEGEAFLRVVRTAVSYGRAVGDTVDQIERVTGQRVTEVLREPSWVSEDPA